MKGQSMKEEDGGKIDGKLSCVCRYIYVCICVCFFSVCSRRCSGG